MARIARVAPSGFVYHVLNRYVGRILMWYVERNPSSAGLVDRARLRRRGSLWSRTRGTEAIKALLSPWPVKRSANRTVRVNAALTTKELDRARGEHRRRTTIWRREVGAGNGKRSWVGADRSSGRPATESEPFGDRGDKLIARIPSSGQINRPTNRAPVSHNCLL
jgi:hypothetical protein